LLTLKCTKFDFGWSSVPDLAAWAAGVAHSAPPDPLAGFLGVLLLRGGTDGRARKGDETPSPD